ncbi:PAS domain-containing protein [Sphingomonas sp. MMS24-JH45]
MGRTVQGPVRVAGQSPGDLYQQLLLAGLHPEDRETADGAVARAIDPAGTGEYDIEYRTVGLDDGIERWVAARGEASSRMAEPCDSSARSSTSPTASVPSWRCSRRNRH